MLAYETEAFAAEAETKAFNVETEAKTFSLEAEERPRHLKFQPRRDRAKAYYCALRRPRDRGASLEASRPSLHPWYKHILLTICKVYSLIFARDSIYAKRAYAIAIPSICPSVCPSVCLSVRHTGGSVKNCWS